MLQYTFIPNKFEQYQHWTIQNETKGNEKNWKHFHDNWKLNSNCTRIWNKKMLTDPSYQIESILIPLSTWSPLILSDLYPPPRPSYRVRPIQPYRYRFGLLNHIHTDTNIERKNLFYSIPIPIPGVLTDIIPI